MTIDHRSRYGPHAPDATYVTTVDVLVHEACRISAIAPMIAGTVFETIFSYHADTVELGAMAARTGVPNVMLTHLIPPPEKPGDADKLVQDLRNGGCHGPITVGEDLTTVRCPGDAED